MTGTAAEAASSHARTDLDRLHDVSEELRALREDIEHAVEGTGEWDGVHPSHVASARNLVQYLKLRQHDVRRLQMALAELGLSSLGRLEAHVGPAIAAVDRAVRRQMFGPEASSSSTEIDTGASSSLLERNADALLGTPHGGRRTRILVTMPSEAADDPTLVARIVASGIEAVRINCAHDDAGAWARMIDNVRSQARAQDVDVKIVMDLAGPKLRTGPILPAPPVRKIKPSRDALGHVIEPARILLSAAGTTGAAGIPVTDAGWLRERVAGEVIQCVDSRGSHRKLHVVSQDEDGVYVDLHKTCYFFPGMELYAADSSVTTVGALPAGEQKLSIFHGDLIRVTNDLEPADPSGPDLRIGCTLPAVFTDLKLGQRVYFDDGKIGGEAIDVSTDQITVRVSDISPTGAKLGAAKGINLPDTMLRLPALTDEDIANLDFVAEHADVVSLSFVRTASDVALLQDELRKRGAEHTGIIMKIETVSGFTNLPDILLQAMRWPAIGVMIARGDLAIEAGYERLAEVQEEIMWLCEAGHVPVIWATQVLDTLAKTGRPSRAEVTDAAMSGRAECVMLNKGPYVANAVQLLTGILRRMAEHHTKKRTLMRRLHAWEARG